MPLFSLRRLVLIGAWLGIATWTASNCDAQSLQHPEPSFDAIFPAGGQVGQTVNVELTAPNGLTGATGLIVDGPPGITVTDVKSHAHNKVTAVLNIAADAAPGRRWIRVVGGSNGLTNCRAFHVGKLPEVLEQESPQSVEVTLPVVINGRLNPTLDIDEYKFQGKQGQKIVAAVLAHRMDTLTRQGNNRGFLDANLELLDERGVILAAEEDSVGLDPIAYRELPADGTYTLRLKSLSFQGFPEAVYRLTVGEIPYPITLFPSGGQRGKAVEVEVSGPNVPPGTKQTVSVAADPHAMQDVEFPNGVISLPFLRGDDPEILEGPTNDAREMAEVLTLPVVVNGRFEKPGDEDWFQVELKAGEGLQLETVGQRHLFSPVDTLIEIYDAAGKKVTENDDGTPLANECLHDFASSDSWLAWNAPQPGKYSIRLRDQGNASGPSAVYRLIVRPPQPDFMLFQWPDAVPIWGPGTTATGIVNVMSHGGWNSDIELQVVGLPAGWKCLPTFVPVKSFGMYGGSNYGVKAFITITAPVDIPIGTVVPFEVIGKGMRDGKIVERRAQPTTLIGNSHNDRMHLRYSHQSRAVVAGKLDSWLETSVTELTIQHGQKIEIPVTLHRPADSKVQMGVTVEGQTVAASCAWIAPFAVKADQSEIRIPFQVNPEQPPGTYSIIVSRSWASDIRGGRPGPCTQAIKLTVLPAK